MKLTFVTYYDNKFPYPSLMLLQLSCDFACLELAFVALFTFISVSMACCLWRCVLSVVVRRYEEKRVRRLDSIC